MGMCCVQMCTFLVRACPTACSCSQSDNVHLEVEDEVSGLGDELIKVLAHDLRQVHFTYLLVYEAIACILKVGHCSS